MLTEENEYEKDCLEPVGSAADNIAAGSLYGVGHGGLFERRDDVSSVAYWYQAEPHNPFPALPPAPARWPR